MFDNQEIKQPEDYLEIFRTAPDHVSEGVLLELVKLGKEAVLPLIKALEDKNEAVRYYSILALDKIGDTRASTALFHALGEEDLDTQQAAAYALINMNETSRFDFIQLLHHPSWRMRSIAAFILGKTQNKNAIVTLCSKLDDPSKEVRGYVAYALSEIADPRSIAALLKALNDDDEFVRTTAIKALGKIGDEKVLDVLQNYEETETSEYIRKTLKTAIGRIRFNRIL